MSGLEGLSRDELIVLVGVQAARIVELVAANEQLAARLANLEHLLSRNSGNSSTPPSKDDQPGKPAPKAKRRRSGEQQRSAGKQKGAPGTHLAWSDTPEGQVDRFPDGRCGCGSDLAGAADLGVVDRYQQTEIPLVTARVTQFDQHAVVCGCGKVHTAARPDGARSGPVGYGPNLQAWCVFLMVAHHLPVHRCVELLESLTGATPSVGFVHGMLARTAGVLGAAHARIRALITLAAVVVMDETPLKVGAKTPRPGRKKADKYLLVACTELYTQFLLGGRDLATFKTSVLQELAAAGAVVVHDRYTVYDNDAFACDPDDATFAGVAHQLCTQHLARDLDDAAEVYPDECWPTQIADALRGLIHQRNLTRHDTTAERHDPRYCRHCAQPTPAPTMEELLRTFRHGVLVGLSRTQSPGKRPGERKARLLLECLADRQADVLRFLTNPAVPPTSNDAERELRPSKIQQNISGRLTSETRTQDRYTILGYLNTAAKHGHHTMTTLRQTMLGQPWIPALPAPT